MKQKLKRFMAGFMAMLTLVGTLFTNGTTAFAASPQANIAFWNASVKNSGEVSELKPGYNHGKILYSILDGNSAYCMNFGLRADGGQLMNSYDDASTSMSAQQRKLLSYCLYYGFNSTQKAAPSNSQCDEYIATQAMVWVNRPSLCEARLIVPIRRGLERKKLFSLFRSCIFLQSIMKLFDRQELCQYHSHRKELIFMPHYNLPHNHGQNIEKVLNKMPSAEGFKDISFLFQQLGDPTRLRILWLLCHCEECVCNLAAAVDMSAPAVSHHLRILKKSGIISSRRDGKEVYYSLSDTPQAKLLHHAIDALFEISCPTEQ